jgi:hypothetical protein
MRSAALYSSTGSAKSATAPALAHCLRKARHDLDRDAYRAVIDQLGELMTISRQGP